MPACSCADLDEALVAALYVAVGIARTDRPLIDAVRAGVLVVDGAMGSLLYERGVLYSACFEELNASRPELVAKVHEDFVRAGAQVIETNTFGANALRLEKYGLSSRVQELNATGVRVARAAAGTQAYVVGAIGPSGYFLGEAGRGTASEDLAKVKLVYLEQARALLDENVDALVVETIRQAPELRAAVEAAVEASEGRVPVIASVSLDENGRMAEGTEAEEIARLAREWGASIVGVNCSDGPMGVLAAVGKMVPIGLPVLASPNAGQPRRVDERMVYVSTPEYFGIYARRMIRVELGSWAAVAGRRPSTSGASPRRRAWRAPPETSTHSRARHLRGRRPGPRTTTWRTSTRPSRCPGSPARSTRRPSPIEAIWRPRLRAEGSSSLSK